MTKLTFIDAGVLIYAARGESQIALKALEVLQDNNRIFASSIFLKMEVLPKAIYNQQTDEIEFYNEYFNAVSVWATDIDKILERAYQEASQFGLGIMDAFHIAAAILVGAEEFITNEKPKKSIHRTPSINIISIHPQS
ncbi:hypothetical protein PCC7805_04357 (plasmid) [Planktothrix agardhii]|jgi:predicted nucleic acid-binding protein|uniref:PIN domain-containing protein n=1 Tax=Planktothrix agardhii TaxID=1160 RepID=A0A1J1JMW9_PLAAG|nr:PIN domain-containing protein [Planktothrix agardhii]BBD57164.1 hypothetical protein NIES204_45000 [Planktothrix agardhii NIES-204]MBG0748613.1 PIN domain-containing protein [Planktothrix agardhii KL2]MCF3578116.1 PIN domain-containing protein [Planktothrix agardhii 1812]MCF3583340.1 PIN domain-containing protein [Planktothrix agardhii 1811]MCF3627449.1 PIN domain-containing protein [Planktothrix agardhii 1801]